MEKQIIITGMTCSSCASSAESILNSIDDVIDAKVNFANSSALIKYRDEIEKDAIQKALQSVGYDIVPEDVDIEELELESYISAKRRTLWSSVLTLPIFIIGMFFMNWEPGKWVSLILSIPILFWFGRGFFIRAFKQLKLGKTNMDTLVALSTGVAFIFSLFSTFFPSYWINKGMEAHVYYEAATVIITLILFGKMLEEKAKSKTSSAIKNLMGLQPKTVIKLENNQEVEMPLDSIQIGDKIVVKPGTKIPVDGTLVSGSSFVNESMITGEPIAIEKTISDKVFAGTVNQKGNFVFKANSVGEGTFLAQIIKLVEKAQSSKAPVQKIVDKIASYFVPIVLIVSLLTFFFWYFIGSQNELTQALLTSVSVLVIACPCALGLATPTAIMVGVGKAAENNILIKDAESLELAYKVDTVVLDKTGTITKGKPSVEQLIWKDDINKLKYEETLYSIEKLSEHPLAEAVVNEFSENILDVVELNHFESITGKGVKALDEKGALFFVGNLKLMNENNIKIDKQFQSVLANLRQSTSTIIYFSSSQEVLAIASITDEIKDSSVEAIKLLKNKGIEVHMLTGDNNQSAKHVASKVEIEHYTAEVLPADKAEYITGLQKKGKIVAMVGDGINDSNSLAQADVSIAMGKGSDIAMDVAKITIINSDLRYISKALVLSQKTVLGIRQNLFWAFIYNLIGIPIAAGVLYPINGFLLNPMIAGGAMAFSSVSVLMNSLRLKSIKI